MEEKQKESEDLTKQKTGDKIESINMVKSEINRLLYQEELTWRQRSRAIWLQVGDKNTKFFDQRASKGGKEIRSLEFLMMKITGVQMTMRLQTWLKTTSIIYSLQHI